MPELRYAYTLRGFTQPEGRLGFIFVSVDGKEKWLNTGEARELARDLVAEADYQDHSMSELRHGLLNKLN